MVLYPVKISSVLAVRFLVNQNMLMVEYCTKLNELLVKTEFGECPLRLRSYTDCAGNSRHRPKERTTFAEGNLRFVTKGTLFECGRPRRNGIVISNMDVQPLNGRTVPTLNFHNILFVVKNLSSEECPVHIVLSTSVDCGKIVFDNYF